MTHAVIKVENLSKQYRLGSVGTGTITHDLNRWWHTVRGREDPYLTLGDENDRTVKGGSRYVWALKDINFEVAHGEVLGIIGSNGAGKSTLLKILSRTTTPTTGSVRIRGRVASLLEVGTGFHPELSGRENIFLNGAILGMSRQEIKTKFDEIVDFAGVERYIDTPVKRYSSGMYVRLAFGVAAHLDPEILIVDEVLAVGDAEFQKKALGKMKDVSSKEGRSVLFVSHNMQSIKSLCSKTIYLQNGLILQIDKTEKVINNYLANNMITNVCQAFNDEATAPGNELVRVKRLEICPLYGDSEKIITIHTPLNIEFEFWNYTIGREINLSLHVFTNTADCVFACVTERQKLNKGLFKAICKIPPDFLNDGIYQVSMMIVADSSAIYNYENKVNFEVNEDRQASGWHGKWPGVIRPQFDFSFVN